MKFNIKHIGTCLFLGGALLTTTTSCNDLLDMDPVSQITPDDFYKSADQLGSYLNNYYNDNFLQNPFSGRMFHAATWDDGLVRSDGDTDIMFAGLGGNIRLFTPDHWEVGAGKALQGFFGQVRTFNYFLSKALPNLEAGVYTDKDLARNYIGEAYFMRALTYYRMLAYYGDMPIIKDVLEDKDDVIVENSKRAPRNEVARFILEDLEKAAEFLADRSRFKGQRINKQVALLLKSRVALFEATFEKYHQGSGRVPGDANWPGAKMAYNSGKSFNIAGEINFFLEQAMDAAKRAIGSTELTQNNGVLEPALGTTKGWNPYFEMYSQRSLADVPEVLLWKQYDYSLNIKHNVPYRVREGSTSGYTRTFIESFLMRDGKPIYASDEYKGDKSLDAVKEGRDLRLQLFLWSESTLVFSDPTAPKYEGKFEKPSILTHEAQIRSISGYQSRKYYSYEYSQGVNDEMQGTNACPAFRIAEGMLNYMEACFEKNGSLDATAQEYWRKIRTRAGVNPDFNVTINATDLSKEGDFGVYSGTTMVDKTLYNIRRERMQELFSEGFRFADLIRWRSFDRMMVQKWIPEGFNFWDEQWKSYQADYDSEPEKYPEIKADGTTNANISKKELSKYVRPYSISMLESNELRDGYSWREAYYLYPIGITDIRTGSADRDLNTSNMYQNINWPVVAGGRAEK